jgi:hypothetical protein
MQYTINQMFGIGEVIETNEDFTTVYFEEVDKEKKMVTSLLTFYNTIEEAEKALNPELSNEEKEASYSEMKAENEAYKAGLAANAWVREYNAECSKNLKKHI